MQYYAFVSFCRRDEAWVLGEMALAGGTREPANKALFAQQRL